MNPLFHDVSIAASAHLLKVVQGELSPTMRCIAVGKFYQICQAMLEAYDQQRQRDAIRREPSAN